MTEYEKRVSNRGCQSAFWIIFFVIALAFGGWWWFGG